MSADTTVRLLGEFPRTSSFAVPFAFATSIFITLVLTAVLSSNCREWDLKSDKKKLCELEIYARELERGG